MQNQFSFVRKGERSGVCHVTKELLIFFIGVGTRLKPQYRTPTIFVHSYNNATFHGNNRSFRAAIFKSL